jgi:predicted nucleic acid-binding protein
MPNGSTGPVAEVTSFVDTNILVYAHDASETVKQPIASDLLGRLWAERGGAISTQILQEFYVVATRKLARPMSSPEAREIVALYGAWPVVVIDSSLILNATRIEEQHRLSFWDALVLEAARVAGAQLVLTEDLQHGRVIEGVRVENPFLRSSGSSQPG